MKEKISILRKYGDSVQKSNEGYCVHILQRLKDRRITTLRRERRGRAQEEEEKVSSKKELGLGDQEATHHTDSILSTGRSLGKPSVEEDEESCEKRSLSETIPESLKGRVEKDSEVSSIPIKA